MISSEDRPQGGLGIAVQRLARLLAGEHEVVVVHTCEAVAETRADDPPSLRQVAIDLSRLPPIAFSCVDHARSAATLLAIEETFGDSPPDYLEVPDYRGHGLVPLQARNAGHRSLRDCPVGVRLHGMAEMIHTHDGVWPPPRNRIVFDFEREVLRLADFAVWPGGDVLALYERFLGFELPATERLRLPVEPPAQPPDPLPGAAGKPLRILYAGRLQRAKGALTLVEACARLDREDWRLTMIGADTETAPLGCSVRDTIETMCVGDPRVTLLERTSQKDLQRVFAEHDLLAVPAEFEVWPNVALEAMRSGLPVLATPVGGLTEIVEDGVSGWLTADAGRPAIQAALECLLAEREEVERVRASGEVFRRFQQLTTIEPILDGYRDLLASAANPPARGRGPARPHPPLVTGIVPYYGEHDRVSEAVRSLLAQTHRNLRVTVVNDGSFESRDRVLDELAADPRVRLLNKPNGGDHTARNLGIVDADGDYIAMLDADDVLEPEFVERAVAMLEADPELAYVTCWLRFLVDGDEALEALGTSGYPPLGNGVRSDEAINSDGGVVAVMPRSLFSRGYRYESMASVMTDWEFYRVLRDDGLYGAVIPELLARCQVRKGSLSRGFAEGTHAMAWDEALSRRRARRVLWAKSS